MGAVSGSAHGDGCFGIEGLIAHQHFVKHHAEAVDIATLVCIGRMALFRAHVIRRAKYLAGPGNLRAQLRLLGQTEIDQHQGTVVTKHDIGGLEVAMCDPYLV